jgi:tetratricopeptide (TPR) repeat protein
VILQIASELRRCAIERAIAPGLSAVEKAKSEIDASPASDPSFIRVLCEIAIWLDFVVGLRGWVEDTLKRWPAAARADLLSCREGLLLRFVESTVWLHKEDYDRAIQGFREMIAAKDILGDDFLYVLANYYAARCRYYQLRYDEASKFLHEAGSQVANLKDPPVHTAVLDILESRILIKQKPPKEVAGDAARLLRGALQALAADDHVTRANLMIFRAQIAATAPHEGEDAAELLDAAVAEIEKHPHAGQPAAGRAYLSRGYEKFRQACALQEQLHVAMQIRRKGGVFTAVVELWPRLSKALATAPAGLVDSFQKLVAEMQACLDDAAAEDGQPAPGTDAEMRRLQDEALADADRAVSIFERLGHRRNLANSLLLIASCMLARRKYTAAAETARKALDSAAGNDAAVESRAWSLAAEIACARYEGDMDSPDPEAHIAEARECAAKALLFAEKADLRTQGIANGVAGRAFLLRENPTMDDWKSAGIHRDFVRSILRKFPEPSLQRRFEALQAKLLSGGHAAATLMKFAQTGEGAGFAELETAISKIAWKLTGTVAGFMELLDVDRHKAEGLLKRAGINPRPPRKMAIRPEGKKSVAAQKRMLENAS